MLSAFIIFIVGVGLAVLTIGIGEGLMLLRSKPKHLPIDHDKVARLEQELLLTPESVIDDTDRLIAELDAKLNPEEHSLREAVAKIAAAHAVPSHLMGGCPACGTLAGWEQRNGHCITCGYRLGLDPHGTAFERPAFKRRQIQPMDALYPIEVVPGSAEEQLVNSIKGLVGTTQIRPSYRFHKG